MKIDDMISAIYKKIADKTLSFGCSVIIAGDNKLLRITKHTKHRKFIGEHICQYNQFTGQNGDYPTVFLEKYIKEIIGHPVMIGDVLDYIEKNIFISNEDKIKFIGFDTGNNDSSIYWKYKFIKLWGFGLRKPIEEQSEDCIEFIYNLIK